MQSNFWAGSKNLGPVKGQSISIYFPFLMKNMYSLRKEYEVMYPNSQFSARQAKLKLIKYNIFFTTYVSTGLQVLTTP